ncbi:RidA family protein [Kitasatospora sp. NPDC048365]|uniref:RidA family protein n=1 Tax=Kitasatospora terrestris TaxID=258051 RepID=A0ABP9DN45_9ACTN
MIQRIASGARMSEAVVHNGTVYLAGQVAGNLDEGVEGQTKQVLDSIDRLLAEAGSDKAKILRAEIFLADIATFAEMNAAWDAWVPAGATPARATVQAALYRPEALVEIVVTAAV